MVKTMRYFILLIYWPILASTSVIGVAPSNTQGVVHVSTDQGGNCTYRISESNTLTPLVHDVDTSLFSGANSDSRAGSVISGTDHYFVAGTRIAAQAADGVFYSRALPAVTTLYGGVTCGLDAEVTFSFTTGNILTGNTYTTCSGSGCLPYRLNPFNSNIQNIGNLSFSFECLIQEHANAPQRVVCTSILPDGAVGASRSTAAPFDLTTNKNTISVVVYTASLNTVVLEGFIVEKG